MEITKTNLQDCYILKPRVFADERGYFMESFNQQVHKNHSLDFHWIQDNEAKSNKGILRGLHFQKGDDAQAKLVRVITGAVQDIVIDMRKNSPTFGQFISVILTSENKHQLLVPRGFAHGYLVLEDQTIFGYKCDNFYNPKKEGGVIFNDKMMNLPWELPIDNMILSEKDKLLPSFENAYYFE